ncbi:MAG TPA: protein kinase [Polyangiaceae bacterium]|nr:protein kinase [Polyangiaceae bacterium]
MVERRPLPSTWVPGSLIPGTVYRIIRLIGQGGMGEVYEVEHDMLGTRRALKGLVKGFAGRTDLAERLRVEARGLARLRHPNLVEVYDLGTALDGRIYFVMELLEGATLRAMLSTRIFVPG